MDVKTLHLFIHIQVSGSTAIFIQHFRKHEREKKNLH